MKSKRFVRNGKSGHENKIVTEMELKYLFSEQIEQTAQNLVDVSIKAFFPKTSYQRFKSYVQSVLFILNNVKMESERI